MQLLRTKRGPIRCITIGNLKLNLRVNHTSENELLYLWIGAAEELIEARLNRSIMQQTFLLNVPSIRSRIALPRPAVDLAPKITKISTFDGSTVTEIDPQAVVLGTEDMLPTITIPSITRDRAGSVQIEYEVGATVPEAVPPGIRQAVMLLASNWYRSREAVPTDLRARAPSAPLPFGADALVATHRIPNTNIDFNDVLGR